MGYYRNHGLAAVIYMRSPAFKKRFECGVDGIELGILLLDIDFFKNINDEYGHDLDDVVLSTLANIIHRNVRQTDVFGRWGGEEFIILCPKISEERLRALAEKFREAVEQHVFETQVHAVKFTVSIGATTVNSHESFEAAFKRADTALCRAKNSGRNRVHLERGVTGNAQSTGAMH